MDLRQYYLNYLLGVYLGTYICYRYPAAEQWIGTIPVILGCVAVLMPLILCYGFKLDKYWSFWVPRIIIIIAILGISLSNYITWRPFFYIRNNLRKLTLRQNYQPLLQEYGRNVEEIKRILHIETLNLSPNGDDDISTLREFWSRIMEDETHSRIKKICMEIFGDLPGTIAECYDLIWLMSICENPHRSKFSKIQLRTIARASGSQLKSLLAGTGIENKDRVSLIFSLISGYDVNTENIYFDAKRYKDISEYPPSLIFNLSFGENGLINDELPSYSTQGPYRFLAGKEETFLEKTLKDVNVGNADDFIEKWGLVGMEKINSQEKISHVRRELSMYGSVFEREKIPPFPDITGLSRSDANRALSLFTNKELSDHYEPRLPWSDRKELLRIIYDDVNGDPRWSFCSLLFCKNDDTMNILTGELHGDENKYNTEDPTLSFGTSKNYQCYQATELLGSFGEFENVFMFRVPDWLPGSNSPREFPIESIKQLQKLIDNYPRYGIIKQLGVKINTGLKTMKDAKQRIRALEQEYLAFNPEEQDVIKLYLAWLFSFGMWMRFWKGPGNPWPVRNAGYELTPETRDAHVIIQDTVRGRLIEKYEKNPKLKKWIEELPVIYIDLTSNEPASCASHTVKSIIEQINEGNYCMGFGSDTILKTGFYFISELLHQHEGKRFNDFMNEQLSLLLDIEENVLRNLVTNDAVTARIAAVRGGFTAQPGFTSYEFRNNRHT